MSLGVRVVVRFVLMFFAAAAIVFLPAGTWRFWQGWTTIAVYFLPTMLGFAYLLRTDRALVERRLRNREQVRTQRWLIRLLAPLWTAAFTVPGFDRRLGWSRSLVGTVPAWLALASAGMVVAGFMLVFWALKTNSYAGRTIQVDAGQPVISTGPYVWVRHPMYAGAVVLWIATALAMGSWVALPVFALVLPFYVIRLLNEEKVLRAELKGYAEYCRKTRYHLIPFVW